MKRITAVFCLILCLIVSAPSVSLSNEVEGYAEQKQTKEMDSAQKLILRARQDLGAEKGDPNLMAITNAAYCELKGKSAMPFVDIIANVTACTVGRGNLLSVHTPRTAPLWFAVFRKDTNRMVYIKWDADDFKTVTETAALDELLQPQVYSRLSHSLIGKDLFSVMSIYHAWKNEANPALLKAGEWHNHICPGLNEGFILAEYLKAKYPLAAGEQYVFSAAPTSCRHDALVTMFDTTVGKSGIYGQCVSAEDQKKYADKFPLPVELIAMKVNRKDNICKGIALGFDWDNFYKDQKIDSAALNPEGGKDNPAFFTSRIDISQKMVKIAPSDCFRYVKTLKEFAGSASLAEKMGAMGADSYKLLLEQ